MVQRDGHGGIAAAKGFSGGWPVPAKPCDSCKSASALLFCRADSAFLCLACDAKVHGANKLASRHERVWMCEVCEQAPASVTCKADAAALCVSCDADIHSANPLARRHERFPVVPFFEPASAALIKSTTASLLNDDDDDGNSKVKPVPEDDENNDNDVLREREEAEAASWLLLNPNAKVMEAPVFKASADTSETPADTFADIFVDKEHGLRRGLMGRSFSDDSTSSAFSDCNSDRSGECSATSSQARRLLLACATSERGGGASSSLDELIRQLVDDLDASHSSLEAQREAALELRLLAKNRPENRLRIARAGAVRPLVGLISSQDPQLQEYGVTAVLNLSLCDENKDPIASAGAGAVKPLVWALRAGTATTRENAACALLRLAQLDHHKGPIGRSGAIPALVDLLETGGTRGKKDAATTLYTLCATDKENKTVAVRAGAMKPLVELMADPESGMVDKAAYVASALMGVTEGRAALVEEGGIPVLVELVEVGTNRQKEIAAAALHQLCEDTPAYRTMVGREGAIPPLIALSQSGTTRGRQKAEELINLLRQPRCRANGEMTGRPSDLSD